MSEGIVRLADGRDLGYREIGPPDAPVVIYCHGFPSNSGELRLLEPTLARYAVRARVVAIDRPGFGRSTFQPSRRFTDAPRDVAELADRLAMGRFAVMGVSGGSPYALACADSLADRVRRVGIVAGVAPMQAAGMSEASVITGPSGNSLLRRMQFELAALAFRRGSQQISWSVRSGPCARSTSWCCRHPRRVRGLPNWFVNPSSAAVGQLPRKPARIGNPGASSRSTST